MLKRYELSDDSVVVVIGSGAGGGTIANELAQKGIDFVALDGKNHLILEDEPAWPRFMEEVSAFMAQDEF